MNKPLRRVAVASLLLIGLLIVNVNYLQGVSAENIKQQPGNGRILIDKYDHERGTIVVDGEAIAYSEETDGRLRFQRKYRNGTLYAPVTGFQSLYSTRGIEDERDSYLDGRDDRLAVRRWVDLVTGKEPKGASVELSLDAKAQRAAYQGLRSSGRRGAAVALDPETGAILAMASLPSYNPNPLASHDAEELTSSYDKYENADGHPLRNRALTETYPPGSVYKVLTAAAALEDDYEPESVLQAPDRLDLPQTDQDLPNFGGSTCNDGSTDTLQHSLQISCNTSFAWLGMQLGEEKMREQAQKFGFGERPEVPMQGAASEFPQGLDQAQLAYSSIGQYDVRVSPLQMAMVAGGVANGGEVMDPYLVDAVKAPDLSTLEEAQPETLSRAMSSDSASKLTGMMRSVVSQGSGTSGQVPGVQVAGKTGTAEHAEGSSPHAWFISFAPADNAKVAVAVLVESGGNTGSEATGGRVAAPIARSIMQAVLDE